MSDQVALSVELKLRSLVEQAEAAMPAVRPEWAPLEALLGARNCAGFMYMGDKALVDGTVVRLYKHGITRRYLNLSDDGRAWRYVATEAGSEYRPVAVDRALERCVGELESCFREKLTTPYREYAERRDRALRAHGFRVLTARAPVARKGNT